MSSTSPGTGPALAGRAAPAAPTSSKGLQLVVEPARAWPAARLANLALDGLVVGCSAAVVFHALVSLFAPRWLDTLGPAEDLAVAGAVAALIIAVFCTDTSGTRFGEAALASGRASAGALVVAVTALGVEAVRGGGTDATCVVLLVLAVVTCAGRELVGRYHRAGAQEGLDVVSHTDELTGLPNRAALLLALTEGSRAVAPADTAVGTLVLLDVDGFRQVNDRLGDAAGDQVLKVVAGAVAASSGAWQTHRTSGDELALLGPSGIGEARACTKRVMAALTAATSASGAPLTASAGIAEVTAGALDPMACLTRATSALRRAQRSGPGSVAEHTDVASDGERHLAVLAARLPQALERGSVVAHLQPILDLRTEAPTGLEALARWYEDDLGWVSPEELLQVAEASGSMTTVGRVLRRSALDAYTSVDGVQRGLRIAFNAFPQELRRLAYADELRQDLVAAGVPMSLVTIEVSESEALSPDDPAVASLELVAALGASVAIDDFGTGYSSLSYLERLPAKIVKVDRLLLKELDTARGTAVLEALVGICRRFGLDVVAEGVEERTQAERLKALGVDYAQGWLWSRALAPAALAEYLSPPAAPKTRRRSTTSATPAGRAAAASLPRPRRATAAPTAAPAKVAATAARTATEVAPTATKVRATTKAVAAKAAPVATGAAPVTTRTTPVKTVAAKTAPVAKTVAAKTVAAKAAPAKAAPVAAKAPPAKTAPAKTVVSKAAPVVSKAAPVKTVVAKAAPVVSKAAPVKTAAAATKAAPARTAAKAATAAAAPRATARSSRTRAAGAAVLTGEKA